MRFTLTPILALAALLAPTALAWGKAIIHNNCGSDVYVWSVGGGVQGPAKVASGSDFAQQFYFDHVSGGVSLKVCESDNGLFTGAPQTIYAYTLDQGSGIVWYDLSDVFGDAFAGRRVELQPADDSCEDIVWADGVSPGGTQTHPCSANVDIVLHLCI